MRWHWHLRSRRGYQGADSSKGILANRPTAHKSNGSWTAATVCIGFSGQLQLRPTSTLGLFGLYPTTTVFPPIQFLPEHAIFAERLITENECYALSSRNSPFRCLLLDGVVPDVWRRLVASSGHCGGGAVVCLTVLWDSCVIVAVTIRLGPGHSRFAGWAPGEQ